MYFASQSLAITRKKPNVYDVMLDIVLLVETYYRVIKTSVGLRPL